MYVFQVSNVFSPLKAIFSEIVAIEKVEKSVFAISTRKCENLQRPFFLRDVQRIS